MPTTTAPPAVPTEKLPLLEENAPTGKIDPKTWDAIARQASRDAQAELHSRRLSYFIGRDGKVIEVLPSGEEKVCVPER